MYVCPKTLRLGLPSPSFSGGDFGQCVSSSKTAGQISAKDQKLHESRPELVFQCPSEAQAGPVNWRNLPTAMPGARVTETGRRPGNVPASEERVRRPWPELPGAGQS